MKSVTVFTRQSLFMFVFALILATAGSIIAWTGPTSTPPVGNVAAPINIGATTQAKTGSLGVADMMAGRFCFGSDCIASWSEVGGGSWLEDSGNTYLMSGNVGIGTMSPAQKLSVAGIIESTSGGFKFPDGTVQTTAGGGEGGTTSTMVPGWPDAIQCGVGGPIYYYVAPYYGGVGGRYGTAGSYTLGGAEYYAIFPNLTSPASTYNGSNCGGLSVSQLVAQGLSFNFIGGGSASVSGSGSGAIIDKVVATGKTVAPVSGLSKWPDYLICYDSSINADQVLLINHQINNYTWAVSYNNVAGGQYRFNSDGTYQYRYAVGANCGASGSDIVSICNAGRCGFFGGGSGISEGATGCPTIGTITEPGTGSAGAACTDGSKFIGRYAGANYFATASDDSTGTTWSGVSTLCSNLDRHGHTDWFLPNLAVLQMMYENRTQIGGFSANFYWSSMISNQIYSGYIWTLDFSVGDTQYRGRDNAFKARCVRRQ